MVNSRRTPREKKSMIGPQLPFSDELHGTKYRGEGEDFREATGRSTSFLSDNEQHFQASRAICLAMRFLPGGRIQAAAGSPRQIASHNCFVSGTIEDSFVHGKGSIMARAMEAASTMRIGGGIGYDFSTLRPRGSLIRKLHSRTSGPVAFMDIFDAICRCIASAGHRRGAQMGTLRIDHPDIMEFIRCKQNIEKLTGFNISVAITDEFMECLKTKTLFKLRWGGEIYEEVDPEILWNSIMRSTWDWAEPGVLFIDTMNRMNNLYYCETIAATNPCGEQPLPPYGACLLGSFNLVKYLKMDNVSDGYFLDYSQLADDIPHIVRMMDNVIDRATYPLYEQEKEAKEKRRMGLGVTALANTGEILGLPYGTAEFLAFEDKVFHFIKCECYRASVQLAKEKGAFPLFDPDKYCTGEFIQTLPTDIIDGIYEHGIRNSHLISVAPTGTISLCADNVSSGIEPVFALSFNRTIQEFDAPRVETVDDYAYRVFGVKGTVAADVTVKQHLDVLITAAPHVDSAISKTCNVPEDTSWEDFKQIYIDAYYGGAKGCTTFRVAGKRMGVLDSGIMVPDNDDIEEDPEPLDTFAASCEVDLLTGRRNCD